MKEVFFDELRMNETDVDGAVARLSGDSDMYQMFLWAFLDDTSMEYLGRAVERQAWDEAFTAAHALKGLAGNLGLTPLFHSLGELVIAIRAGRINEIASLYNKAQSFYDDIIAIIRESRDEDN